MKVLAWPAFKTRYKNPYNWLLYSPMADLGVEIEEFSPQKLLTGSYDIIHIHWPVETIVRHVNQGVALARVLAFLSLLWWARQRGAAILWTIHDEYPHVLLHPDLAAWCEAQLVGCVDGTIHICDASRQIVFKKYPALAAKPSFVIPHGHYREAYPNQMTQAQAREQLSIPSHHRVMLFLGNISPYKNVPLLTKTFRQLPNADITLLVAGKPDKGPLCQDIQSAAGEDPRIQLHLRFIPDGALQQFFNAADLVVLPFQAILNSGSTLLALSFNRPVLAPNLGALPEWNARFGASWVRTYAGSLTPEILQSGLESPPLPGPEAIAPIGALDWNNLAQETLNAYRKFTV